MKWRDATMIRECPKSSARIGLTRVHNDHAICPRCGQTVLVRVMETTNRRGRVVKVVKFLATHTYEML